MSVTLERLVHHRRTISMRTGASLAVYAGFLGASVVSALQYRPLEDVVTLTAFALVIGAFLILPRDYVPAVLLHRAETDPEEAEIARLQRYERIGIFIRIAYVLGAVLTVVVLPWLGRPG